MDRTDVQRWLDDYVAAWRANDAAPITRLFAEDAIYNYHPYADEEAIRGRDAIVTAWLAEPDPPDSWEAQYEPFAVDGDRAVAVGWSRYFATVEHPERLFHNCFLLRFDAEGRCTEFVEFYMQAPAANG
jgi:hypothetical protein